MIKAAGVTFAISMIERVIEERAAGDPTKALEIRQRVQAAIGESISQVAAGSETAAKAKEALQAEGLWSQYLEVGIGPDPEIFTKAPVLSAVGAGARIGVLSRSAWNNPEPEVVLVARPDGQLSVRPSATTSTCATSRVAAPCCSVRPRTTTPPPPSGR